MNRFPRLFNSFFRRPEERIRKDNMIDRLVEKEIRTLRELQEIRNDSVFIALDCKTEIDHVTGEPAAFEVGLASSDQMLDAYIPDFQPDLMDLYSELRMVASAFAISPRYERNALEIDPLNANGIPLARETFEFGEMRKGHKRRIEKALCQKIQSHINRARQPNIVLVGYHLDSTLIAMRNDFSAVAGMFTACVDLRHIFRSLCPGDHINELGILDCLDVLGYGPFDYGLGYRDKRFFDAGNDAVRTLALLYALADAGNIQSLIDEHTRELSLKLYNHCLPLVSPYLQELHVCVEADDRHESLPSTLRKMHNFAAFLEPYKPRLQVGLNKESMGAGGIASSRHVGWVVFENGEARDRCIAALNQTEVDGTLLYVGPQRQEISQ
ncbi:hypothetical protein F5Y15DRAFT_428545 [Xylariaceae sp. FL0016]|nr:hypothetical protein F5Y15DRAFT_428545 [Xylariaceae sp. FL0016]